ncbi:hypothetical protein ACF0H5_018655 [Mactra antiquata]
MVLTTRPSAVNIIQTRSSRTENSTANSSSANQVEAVTFNSEPQQIMNMGGSSLKLEHFKGEYGEDVEKFLRRFDEYCTCMNFKNSQALGQLAWHLDGVARLYYESLTPVPDTLQCLKELLLAKYKTDTPISLNIFSMKQETNENTEQFLSRLEAETFKTQISDELQVQIALNGLHPSINSAISSHGPKTLTEVRNLARRLINVRNTPPSVNQVSPWEDQFRILTNAVAQLTTVVSNQNQEHSSWSQRNQPARHPPQMQRKETCSRCGGRCTSLKSCRALGKTCDKCGFKNHFKSQCRTGRRRNEPNSS